MSRFITYIPDGWELKSVADVYSVNDDVLGTNTPADHRFKYLELELVDTQRIDYERAIDYTFADAPGRARRPLKSGDYLFCTVRPNLQGFAKFEPPIEDETWVGSTGLAVARAKPGVQGDFVFYQLLSEIGQRQFHALVTGSNYPAISENQFRKLELLSPGVDEQRHISNALSLVDTAIVSTQASIAAAKKLKQALMQNLLTGKLKPDGRWRREDEFYIDPKFGRVPKRWSVTKGKALFRIHGSTASKDSRGEPLRTTCLFMKVEDFNTPANDPFIVETDNVFEAPSPKPVYPCKPGWLVVAKRGAAISHNRVRMLEREAVLDPNLMAIEMFGEHSPEYFRYVLLLERLDRFSEVSSIPQLNNKDLYPRSFVIPPPDEQPEILKAIESVEDVVQHRIKKLSSLRTLKASLMQNLLTGKIRIPAE